MSDSETQEYNTVEEPVANDDDGIFEGSAVDSTLDDLFGDDENLNDGGFDSAMSAFDEEAPAEESHEEVVEELEDAPAEESYEEVVEELEDAPAEEPTGADSFNLAALNSLVDDIRSESGRVSDMKDTVAKALSLIQEMTDSLKL